MKDGTQPGETQRCEACEAPLIACLTKAGKVAPIVFNPSDEGNVLVFRKDGDLHCRTFGGDTLAKLHEEGVPLRTNHFADCPERERFKR
jgi:hypothetical protein